jgi:hypothetical protein
VTPKVVTLCGSSRFREEIRDVGRRESLAGHVVLGSWSFSHAEGVALDAETIARLKTTHFHMIRIADEVVIVAPGGYMGPATLDEKAYAEFIGKPVRVEGGA